MKLPLPFVLYFVSTSLLGTAGWGLYEGWPDLRGAAGTERSKSGRDKAAVKVDDGRQANPPSADWNYASQPQWWQTLRLVDLTGREPEQPPGPPIILPPPPGPPVMPLEEIVELVSAMYDPFKDGRGGQAHVTIRYKATANVQAPGWYVRETQAAVAGSGVGTLPSGMGTAAQSAARAPQARLASTPMPLSNVGREYLQRVFVAGDGSIRQGQKLWPPYDNIRLVRVSADAQVAWFVREPPPSPREDGEQVAAPQAPAEERLRMSAMGLSQDQLEMRDKLLGTNRAAAVRGVGDVIVTGGEKWIDDAAGETRQIGASIHVGRNDEQMFREDPEHLFSALQADTYVSRFGSTRGVRLTRVEPAMARRFGVLAGEVIVAINGEAVATKADALAVGKRQYDRGTRTFVVRFLATTGQFVERTYIMPERKR